MKKLITILILLALASCTVPPSESTSQPETSKAEQAVLDEGYTDPVYTGVPLLSCGQDDSILTSKSFKARNSNGVLVELTVCCGLLLKGCTVRH